MRGCAAPKGTAEVPVIGLCACGQHVSLVTACSYVATRSRARWHLGDDCAATAARDLLAPCDVLLGVPQCVASFERARGGPGSVRPSPASCDGEVRALGARAASGRPWRRKGHIFVK